MDKTDTLDLVSIIVPVYNVETYLALCLHSLNEQTYKNTEIILVDDGSDDNSGAICDEFASENENVIVIHQTNQGVSNARNVGMNMAKGNWIMFVDADDWVERNMVEILVSKISYNADVICCSFFFNYPNKEVPGFPVSHSTYWFPRNLYLKELLKGCILNTATWSNLFIPEMGNGPIMTFPVLKLYKVEMLRRNNIVFPVSIKIGEDKCFNLDVVSKANGVCYINEPLYHYRQRMDSASNKDIVELSESIIDMYNHIQKKTQNTEYEEDLKEFLYLEILRCGWSLLKSSTYHSGRFCRSYNCIKEYATKYKCELEATNLKYVTGIKKKLISLFLKHNFIALAMLFSRIESEYRKYKVKTVYYQ